MDKKVLDLFRRDLCKDQRKLEIIEAAPTLNIQTTKIIRKHGTTYDENLNEISSMNYLRENGINGIPKFLHNSQQSKDYIEIEYFEGIRVFNMLAYLRDIARENLSIRTVVIDFRTRLLERCLERQRNIQNLLISWRRTRKNRMPYPLQKLKNTVYLLSCAMQLPTNIVKINEELDRLNLHFFSIATVPFRDATTKNMIVHVPSLHLDNFLFLDQNDILEANERRKKHIISSILNGTFEQYIEAPLIDIDFASCEHDTTIYDDAIGFSCHEITWNGVPDRSITCWNQSCELVNEDIALSFIIRYLRFGGRKLAYKMIHPDAYPFRFHYDDGQFYFKKLNLVIEKFWSDAPTHISELMRFIDFVANADINKFVYYNDIIHEMCKKCDRKFYLDIYPY